MAQEGLARKQGWTNLNKFAFQVGAFPLTPGEQKRGVPATSSLRIERLQAHKAGERVSVFRTRAHNRKSIPTFPFAVGEAQKTEGTPLFVVGRMFLLPP